MMMREEEAVAQLEREQELRANCLEMSHYCYHYLTCD